MPTPTRWTPDVPVDASNQVLVTLGASPTIDIGDVSVIGMPSVATSVKLSPVGGAKTVTTSGTGVALAATVKLKYLYVRAKAANTNNIYFGDSAVDATSSKQIILAPNQSVVIQAEPGFYVDIAEFFIDADTNGEGVDFVYVA